MQPQEKLSGSGGNGEQWVGLRQAGLLGFTDCGWVRFVKEREPRGFWVWDLNNVNC